MNIFPYLPPAFSIYLVAISYFVAKYAKTLITSPVQRNVARDWEARIGFINSMLASLVSVYSIFEASQSYLWVVLSSLALLCIFVPMFFWIISHKAGELASIRTRRGRLLHMDVCAIVLVIVNILLLCAIGINQRLSASP